MRAPHAGNRAGLLFEATLSCQLESMATSSRARPAPPVRRALPTRITAADYLDILWQYLTEAVCDEVFAAIRARDGSAERQRKWTLYTLLKFWIVLLHEDAEVSQTRAVADCATDHPLYPTLTASAASFFQRIQSLRPAFFRAVFTHVTARVRTECVPRWAAAGVTFCTDLPIPTTVFPDIYCVDASRADKVAHRVGVLQRTTRAVLPGSIEAVYDLRRGVLRDLYFDPDGCRGERRLFEEVLADLPSGALLVGDRYYGTPCMLDAATMCGQSLVARHVRTATQRKRQCLRKVRTATLTVDDWLVDTGGTGQDTVAITIRYVRITTVYKGRVRTLTFVTNVLDPTRLPAEHLAALYGLRWTIERMFLTLKATLRLNRLFNSTPAAVGQQVYATALLYNALRLAQLEVAHRLGLPPEQLSPEKLFPLVMDRLERRTWIEVGALWQAERLQAAYPDVELPPVDPVALAAALTAHPSLMLPVRALLVERRTTKRKTRRYCAGRGKAPTSFAHLHGGKRYLEN